MLDANLKKQLDTYLQHIVNPIEVSVSTDDSPKGKELHELAVEIADARHPVVELAVDMVDPVVQRAAEGDVDLLHAAAHREDGNALGDAFTDQR